MYDLLKEFIKPELLILIPVLYLFGAAIKKSNVDDKYIPFILGAAGIVLSVMYLITMATDFSSLSIVSILFTGIVQGVLIAGASVYVNQLIKQGNE